MAEKEKQKETGENYEPKKAKWQYRYATLLIVCFISSVSLYCFQSTGGLVFVITQVMGINVTKYDLLFSVIAWPNIVLCLFGGVVIDRFLGIRAGYVIVCTIATLGQLVWAVGAFAKLYWVMVVGRFVLGAGNQLTMITAYAINGVWFRGREISFAVSLHLSLAGLGGALALIEPEYLYEHLPLIILPKDRLGLTLLVGVALQILTILGSIVYVWLDTKRTDGNAQHIITGKKEVNFCEFKDFSLTFWMVTAINAITVGVADSFVGIAQIYYIKKYQISVKGASFANFLILGSTFFVTPLIGIMIDATGFNIFWTMGGIILGIVSHLMMAGSLPCQTLSPYLVGVVYSFSYNIIGSAVRAIPVMIIKDNQLSTAYGFFHSAFNLALSVIALTSGVIIDYSGYFAVEIFFSFCLGVAFLLALVASQYESTTSNQHINVFRWKHFKNTHPLLFRRTI